MNHDLEINYKGLTEEEFIGGHGSRVSVLSGTNNCGKSLILKLIFDKFRNHAYFCGANRYYELEHFPTLNDDPNYDSNTLNNFRNQINEPRFNRDPVLMPFNDVFIRLTDEERQQVYKTCSECLGEEVSLDYESPGNSMSKSFLRIGETPIAKCSSGSRLLVHLVSILFSKRFEHVFIDEPEIGLTPKIQDALQDFLFSKTKESLLHLKHIFIATHSHIFLNRLVPKDNFLITRNSKSINIHQIATHQEFIDLQFNQLGNSFRQLQLPNGFLLVEGKTDFSFLSRLFNLKLPNHKIKLTHANGDGEVKHKLHQLLEVIGSLSTSPYNNRVLVILDEKHSPTLKPDLEKMGLPADSVIEFSENGIEYYYPESILREIYRDESLVARDLTISNDTVSYSGIEKTKVSLCCEVVDKLEGDESLNTELLEVIDRIKMFA